MAHLPEGGRAEVWAELMREASGARRPLGLTKGELRAAVDATDAWIEANAAGFNSALPQPARGALSPAEKAWLLSYVAIKRYRSGA